MPWLGMGAAGDFGEQPTAALSGSFNAQGAVPRCKGAVPGWEARGSLHVLVGALISCSTGDQSDFRVLSQRESLDLLCTSDL